MYGFKSLLREHSYFYATVFLYYFFHLIMGSKVKRLDLRKKVHMNVSINLVKFQPIALGNHTVRLF